MHQYMIFTSRFTDPDPEQLVDCGSCYLEVCPGASFPCVHCVYDLMGSLLGPRGDQLFKIVFTLTMTAATCPMMLLMFSVHSPVPHISSDPGWLGPGHSGANVYSCCTFDQIALSIDARYVILPLMLNVIAEARQMANKF